MRLLDRRLWLSVARAKGFGTLTLVNLNDHSTLNQDRFEIPPLIERCVRAKLINNP
jgi:hypothetical protein